MYKFAASEVPDARHMLCWCSAIIMRTFETIHNANIHEDVFVNKWGTFFR